MKRRSVLSWLVSWLGMGLGVMSLAGCAAQARKATPPRAAQRVFIVHGYRAGPSSHWFPWLRQRLEERGVQAVVVALPRSTAPDFDRWQEALHAAVGQPRADDVFVAHSLGTISTLHYLSAHRPQRIGGLVLVSGFAARLPRHAAANGYSVNAYIDRANVDVAYLQGITPHIHSIISENDSIVAPQESMKLARSLKSAVMRVPQGGHFLAHDGFTQLPQAWQVVEPLLGSQG